MEKYYITDEDIERASKNGISYNTLYQRVWTLNWSIERAVNTPTRQRCKRELPPNTKERLNKNNITFDCFSKRLKNGWEYEKAISTPTLERNEIMKIALKKALSQRVRTITDEDYEKAAMNGISRQTLFARIKYFNWDIERATTQRVDEHKLQNPNHVWRTDWKVIMCKKAK